MLLGVLGGKEDWGEGMWRSLEATIKMVNEISGGSKRVVGKFINSPIDLLECIGKPKRRRNKNIKDLHVATTYPKLIFSEEKLIAKQIKKIEKNKNIYSICPNFRLGILTTKKRQL